MIFLLIFFMVGCSNVQPSFLSYEKKKLLLFAMGGRSSCGAKGNDPKAMSMYPRIERLADLLREEGSVEVVPTCFDRYANLFFAVGNKTQAAKPEDISDLANNKDKDQVLLVGHSYGGWLAMRTVANLNTSRAHLYTIDAISPIECELGRPTSWLGCQRAPKDVSWDSVASNSFAWNHFYQTTTPYLHSTAIPNAENQHVPGVGHTKIDEAPQVWYNITKKF